MIQLVSANDVTAEGSAGTPVTATIESSTIALTPDKNTTHTDAKNTIHSLVKVSDLPMTYVDG